MDNKKAIDLLSMIEFEHAECCLNTWYKGIDDDMKEALEIAKKALKQTRWIPVSKQLPKENEYIEDVCKYYLIQDEYRDMHVAHLSNVGWIPMDSLKAIGNEIVAWQELPQPYKIEPQESEVQDAGSN